MQGDNVPLRLFSAALFDGGLHVCREGADVGVGGGSGGVVGFGLGDDFGVGQGVDRRAGHDFGDVEEAFVGDAGFALGGELPGVAGGADGVGGAAGLDGGDDPGDVAHIGAAHHGGAFGVDGDDEVAEGFFEVGLGTDAAVGAGDVFRGEGGLDLLRVFAVGFVEGGRAEAFEGGVHGFFERGVAEEVGHR